MNEISIIVMLAMAGAALTGVLVGVIVVLLLDRHTVPPGRPPDDSAGSPVEVIDPDEVEFIDPVPDFESGAAEWARRAGRPEAAGPAARKMRTAYDISRSRGLFGHRHGSDQ